MRGHLSRVRHRNKDAVQAVGRYAFDPDLADFADQMLGAIYVDRLKVWRAADSLPGLSPRLLKQHRHCPAVAGRIESPLLLREQRLQRFETPRFYLVGNLCPRRRRRSRSRAVLE